MACQKIDPELRKAIKAAQQMISEVAKADGNESETRRRVERLFDSLMGYDVFKHITREHAVRGPGTTEYCDFAIQLESGGDVKPVIMVELKRVNIDLSSKHLKQVASYAINAGCEWILLTNGKEWRLYHVTFGQPPETKLLHHWDILRNDIADLASYFDIISYRNVKKGGLEELWEKATVLTAHNVLSTILSEDSIKVLRRGIKKSSGVSVTPEDIVGALRRLLNENALTEMDDIKISLPEKPRRTRKKKAEVKNEGDPQSTATECAQPETQQPTDEPVQDASP